MTWIKVVLYNLMWELCSVSQSLLLYIYIAQCKMYSVKYTL